MKEDGPMGIVEFKAGTQLIRAEVLSQTTMVSRHSGKELNVLEVRFRTDQSHKKALEEAISSGFGNLVNADRSEGKTVTLFQKQQSYTVGEAVEILTWVLTEKEELKLDALQIEELTVQPYRYEESFDGDALILTARVQIDASTLEALRALPKYFPVVRKGISDGPRSMRFGQVVWSSDDENQFKIHATVVEQVYDTTRSSNGFLEPRFGNVMDSLVSTNARFKALMDVLEAKAVITADEKEKIIDVPTDEVRRRILQFDRVLDVDGWFGLGN
jgi:hypothetical protein